MRLSRRQAPMILIAALAASQAGHLLVYGLRFGATAGAVQSGGAHAYFVAFAGSIFALGGAAFIVALLFIGLARLASTGPAPPVMQRASVMDLLAVLFTLQLTLFVAQEGLETTQAGTALSSAVFVWGIAGQLPVAVAAAVALSLISARFEAAVLALRQFRPKSDAGRRLAILVACQPAAREFVPSQALYGPVALRGPPGHRPTTS